MTFKFQLYQSIESKHRLNRSIDSTKSINRIEWFKHWLNQSIDSRHRFNQSIDSTKSIKSINRSIDIKIDFSESINFRNALSKSINPRNWFSESINPTKSINSNLHFVLFLSYWFDQTVQRFCMQIEGIKGIQLGLACSIDRARRVYFYYQCWYNNQ